MPTRPTSDRPKARREGSRVYIRPPRRTDAGAFLAGVASSRRLHQGWVQPPTTAAHYAHYVSRFAGAKSREPATATHVGFLVFSSEDHTLVGVFNVSEIVRGSFQSAYLGYYGFAPHDGAGYMRHGLNLVLENAFRKLRLHRLEANIQPDNSRSIGLVRDAGFTREGFSRQYIKVAGRWRDHERWAMLVDDWRQRSRREP
jgi:ribosomal-protein-alanine N-acetyltransferase